MTTAFSDPGTHPVAAFVTQSHADLDDLDPRLWSMTDRELAQVLPALTRLRQRIAALELAAAHQADTIGLGTEVGAADTAAYWANTTRQTRAGARRRLKLAAALDQHETTHAAMAAGTVAEDQAAVIVKAVEELPVMQAEAETELVRLAAEHDAHELGIVAKHILEVVAPDIAEEHQRQALEREEERAREDCRFTIADDGHGQCHGRFTVPSPVGAMLRKAVLAYAAPKHRQHSATPAGLGHAFCEYVERYPTDRLPQAGGVNATVVVRMTMESLLGDSEQPATLDTGHQITAGQARRLACEAGLIPMVLGRTVPGPGPRTRVPVLHQAAAGRPRRPRQDLHRRRAATGRPGCATPITTSPGAGAGRPTSTTAACCARGITRTRTPRRTR